MDERKLLASFEQKPLVPDVRTKLMLMVLASILVLGGAGKNVPYLQHIVCWTVFILFLLAGKLKPVLRFGALYLAVVVMTEVVFPNVKGGMQIFLAAMMVIFVKLMPMILIGGYIVSTTTVSEFSAAFKKMHVPDEFIVPFCVMFRMFPTIASEFRSINEAMRMRGITFSLRHPGRFFEYRIVPLIICVVKIGDELAQSAMTRGLGGEGVRTCVSRIRLRAIDYVMTGLYLAVIAAAVVL